MTGQKNAEYPSASGELPPARSGQIGQACSPADLQFLGPPPMPTSPRTDLPRHSWPDRRAVAAPRPNAAAFPAPSPGGLAPPLTCTASPTPPLTCAASPAPADEQATPRTPADLHSDPARPLTCTASPAPLPDLHGNPPTPLLTCTVSPPRRAATFPDRQLPYAVCGQARPHPHTVVVAAPAWQPEMSGLRIQVGTRRLRTSAA
jgi:hypothetical protein